METAHRPFDVIEHFQHAARVLNLPKGAELFKAGDPGDVMYVVMAGYANILVGSTIVEIAAPGSLVGEMALVDRQPRSASVVARTACQFVPIGVAEFDLLVRETPAFSRYVLRIITERLRRMNDNLSAMGALDRLEVGSTADAPGARASAGYSYAPRHTARLM